MSTDKPTGGLSLMEAVDALTALSEQHWEQGASPWVEIEEEIDLKHPEWILGKDQEKVRETVRDLFKTVLHHFKQFYQNEYTLATNSKTLEGIKSIMVIVGEAAKKIDHFTTLFKETQAGAATKLHEYRQLQDFYKKKISRTIDEALLGKWLLALTQRTLMDHERRHAEGMRSLETRHVFVDLEAVKQDKEYELFFIKKEDGSRFFNPRIIKNIKLISDFSVKGDQTVDEGLFIEQRIWEERAIHLIAERLLSRSRAVIDRYYRDLTADKDRECQGYLNMAIMALLLSSGNEKLGMGGVMKSSREYFADFRYFFRRVLDSRDYNRFIAYPYEERTKSEEAVLKISSVILFSIFEGFRMGDDSQSYMGFLLSEARKGISHEHWQEAINQSELWSYLSADFNAMKKMFKKFPYESIDRILNELEIGFYQEFDPWMQGGFPLKVTDELIILPSPTKQEYIHQACADEEFINYLRFHQEEEGPVVLFNFQDRTDWREHARCQALENLMEMNHFSHFLTVATIPKDTPFYWQDSPYQEEHQAELFREHLLEQMADNHGGYFLSDSIRKVINRAWLGDLFDAIHSLFFHGRNVLSRESRLEFIEIFHLFLQKKLTEISGAKKVFMTCKDGIDTSVAAAALTTAWNWCLNPVESVTDMQAEIDRLLFIPAVFHRHRLIHAERLERVFNALKAIEAAKNETGEVPFKERVERALNSFWG